MSALFPALLMLTVLIGLYKRVDIYDALLSGVREGLLTAYRVLPPMLVMLLAARAFSASGCFDLLCGLLAKPLEALGIPRETLPLFLFKPLSGSGSLAALSELLKEYGPDSRAGLAASTMMGASDTVFYVCALYLGAAGVKKSRHIVPCALAAWLTGSIAAALLSGCIGSAG